MGENIDCYGIISKQFTEELYKSTEELVIDYGELALASVFKSNISSEIPIIKTLASTYKIGIAVRERFFAKKLLVF